MDMLYRNVNLRTQHNMMGYSPSVENKINIHVGGAYGDKESALNRFCSNFQKLDENTKRCLLNRLTKQF